MMTKSLFALLISLVLISSCRHPIEPIKPNAWRVRTQKTEFELTTYNYKNGQLVQSSSERLKKDTTWHLPNVVCTNYSKENGSLVQRTCGTNNVWNFQNILGANGKIAEQNWAYTYRVNIYDTNGFLIEERHYSLDPN
jgi:hypothetical protein